MKVKVTYNMISRKINKIIFRYIEWHEERRKIMRAAYVSKNI
jgi:hypothetical protein